MVIVALANGGDDQARPTSIATANVGTDGPKAVAPGSDNLQHRSSIPVRWRNGQRDGASVAVASAFVKETVDLAAARTHAMAEATQPEGPARPSSLKFVTYIPGVAPLESAAQKAETADEAKRRFEAVLATDPNNVAALLGLADLRARAGASSESLALIEKAIAANATAPTPRLALIAHYMLNKDPKKAVGAARQALEALPDNPDVIVALGTAQLGSGETDQAIATFTNLTKRYPDSAIAWFRLAQAQAAAKAKPLAIENLRKALAIKPDFLDAQRALVGLEYDVGHLTEAVAVAREVQKQRPNESIGYILEGDRYAYRRQWRAAASAYRNGLNHVPSTDLAMKLYAAMEADGDSGTNQFADTWLKDHPQDDIFRLFMAGVAMDRNDYRAAAKQYRAILELHPDNSGILNNLAWAAAQVKDPKAIEYAEKAHSISPKDAHIMDTLGTLLVDQGNVSRGVQVLRDATTLAPDSGAIRLHLAQGLIKAGQKNEARKELEDLQKLGDKFPRQKEVADLMKRL